MPDFITFVWNISRSQFKALHDGYSLLHTAVPLKFVLYARFPSYGPVKGYMSNFDCRPSIHFFILNYRLNC